MKNKETVFEVMITPDEFYKLMFSCSFLSVIYRECNSELHDKLVKYKMYDSKQMPDYDGKENIAMNGLKTSFNLEESICIYTGTVVLTNCYHTNGLKDISYIGDFEWNDEYISIIIKHWDSLENIHSRIIPLMIDHFMDSPVFKARMDLLNTKIFPVN